MPVKLASRPARTRLIIMAAVAGPRGAARHRGPGRLRPRSYRTHRACHRRHRHWLGQAHHRPGARRVGRLRQLERRHRASAARWLHRLRPAQPAGRPGDRYRHAGRFPAHHHRPDRPGRALLRRRGHHQRRNRRQPGQSPGLRRRLPAGARRGPGGPDHRRVMLRGTGPVHGVQLRARPRITIRRGRLRQADRVPRLLRQRPAGQRRRGAGRYPAAPGHQHVYRPVRCPGLADHPVLGRRSAQPTTSSPRPSSYSWPTGHTPTSPRSTPPTCQ